MEPDASTGSGPGAGSDAIHGARHAPDAGRFRRDGARALGDATLRRNYAAALGKVRGRRDELMSALTDSAELMRVGHAVKQHALNRLPELLEELEAKLTARGVQVHWAETTEQANGIVLDIARRRGVTSVVKGKSMVYEEMELNLFLAGHGIEALEADLGEFIVQLAGQHPVHIVVPAIHMSRTEIARLF